MNKGGIIFFGMFIFISSSIFGIDTVAYREIAIKHFAPRITKHNDFQIQLHPRYRDKIVVDLDDTSKISLILPIYPLKHAANYDSLLYLIDFRDNPLNQAVIVVKESLFYSFFLTLGIAKEREQFNKDTQWKSPKMLISEGSDINTNPYLFGRFDYFKLIKFMRLHPNFHFFLIWDMDGIWALHSHTLLHITFDTNKIITTNGQELYENLIKENGLDCVLRLIDGYKCKQLLFK